MNRLTMGLLLGGALAASSCGPVPIGFDIGQDLGEQSVPGDPAAHAAGMALGESAIMPITVSVDINGEARARNIPIARILLKSMELSVTPTNEPDGDTDDFAFITSSRVFIESTRADTTLPRVEAATVGAGSGRTLAFTVAPGVNLKDYYVEGMRFSLEVQGIPPEDNTSFDGRVVLRVEPF